MSSLRETKNRIKSVQSTEKITRAMKMVAASKLRRAQEAVLAPRSYADKLLAMVSSIASKMKNSDAEIHPLLASREKKERVLVLSLTSDRGLCGALNSSVVRSTHRFIFDHQDQFGDIAIATIGKKGFEGLNRLGLKIEKNYGSNSGVFDYETASSIASELCERFLKQDLDAIYLVYNEFKSAINQDVVVKQLLPVKRQEEPQVMVDFLYEPDQKELLESLVSKHFATMLYQAFLESYASEQGARMTAMDNATRNAKEMTEKLTLQYNRARQAAITTELMEIIGGAEAL